MNYKVLSINLQYKYSMGSDPKEKNSTGSDPVVKTAFQIQLIEDGHIWIDALEKRSLMAHTYNEEVAEEAVELIRKSYYPIIKKLCSKLEELQ